MEKLATSLSRIVTFRYGMLGAPGRLKYALDVPKTPGMAKGHRMSEFQRSGDQRRSAWKWAKRSPVTEGQI
jgi:hypothetical protein